MKNIYADSVIIEIGRKCNLRCAHCLRGPAENKTIDIETAKKFLSEFSGIESLTFTGGEPCLYADEIIELINYIMENEISVMGFYIASNGTIKHPALMMKLIEFRSYCEECFGGYDCDEQMCLFDISNDMFHDGYENNLNWFKGFSFCGTRNQKNGADTSELLIDEGNAAAFGIGVHKLRYKPSFDIADEWDDGFRVDMMYLNAEGYILPDCDYSYQTQREMKPFKYGELSMEDIIFSYHYDTIKKTA